MSSGLLFHKRLKAFLEWIHIGILFATFYPVSYIVLLDRDERMILSIFLAGFIILLPTAVAKIAAHYVKSFTAYALICIFTGILTVLLSGWIGGMLGYPDPARAGYQISVLIETVIVVIEAVLIRMRENSRARALLENDITWTDREYLLEKPILPMLVWFVVLYIFSKMFKCSVGCDIAVVCFFLYGACACLEKHLTDTEHYISVLSYVKQFPARRIRLIGTGVVLSFLLVAGICAVIPSAVSAGYRTYYDIRAWVRMMEERGVDFEGDPLGLSYVEDPFDQLLRGQKMIPVPPWVDQLVKTLGMIFLAGVLVLAIRMFWRFCREFRDKQEENGDISVSLEADVIEKIPRPLRRARGEDSERDRIRRRYRREIRRRRKERPAPSETPTEIEAAAGLAGTAEGRDLHETYEKARYG